MMIFLALIFRAVQSTPTVFTPKVQIVMGAEHIIETVLLTSTSWSAFGRGGNSWIPTEA